MLCITYPPNAEGMYSKVLQVTMNYVAATDYAKLAYAKLLHPLTPLTLR
jgi:hypothetical protein